MEQDEMAKAIEEQTKMGTALTAAEAIKQQQKMGEQAEAERLRRIAEADKMFEQTWNTPPKDEAEGD